MCKPFSSFRLAQLILSSFLGLVLLNACTENQGDAGTKPKSSNNATTQETISDKEIITNKPDTEHSTAINYELLQKKIIYGSAQLFDVKQALTQEDVGALTNTMHGLYSMRWHRGVYNLLEDIWALKTESHPDLAWESLKKIPVRIALASTLNRIKIINTDEQLEYIRAHKDDDHEFHRAQVVVALGMNGKEDDIEYIKSMAMADNPYVAQSALSGLALMGGDKAKYALAEVWKEFKGTKRGDLAEQLIQKIYKESPTLEKPVTEIQDELPAQ